MIPKVCLVILNYNGKDDTVVCLQSLEKIILCGFTFEVVIVDNNSSDNSVSQIESYIRSKPFFQKNTTKLIKNNTNFGYCEGNNQGMLWGLKKEADFFLLLNNDTVVDKNLVIELLQTAKQQKTVGIIGPKIYFAKGFEYHTERYKEEEKGKVIWYAGGMIDWNNILFSHRGVDQLDGSEFSQSQNTDFVSGCAMLIKRAVIEKIGMFDPKYYLYLEDVDLCERAKRVGFKLWYEPKAVLWHKNASSSGKPGSSLHVYYQTRNRLLFGYKYGKLRTKFALLRESFKQLSMDSDRRQAIFDFYFGRFGERNIR